MARLSSRSKSKTAVKSDKAAASLPQHVGAAVAKKATAPKLPTRIGPTAKAQKPGPATGAIDRAANQAKYLDSVAKTGTAGQKAWAKAQQAKKK